MAPPDTPSPTVYLLPLTDDGAPDVPKGYVYLPPPTNPAYILRFIIDGTSTVARHGSLWENSVGEGEQFDRRRFREHKLKPNFNRAIEIDIPITTPGAFEYYLTYRNLPPFSVSRETTTDMVRSQTHYFNIAPRLALNHSPLPLNSLSIISTISKFMGPYPSSWHAHLRGMGNRGYNMVHFTPLMQRGQSNSPYSIYDQFTFDPTIFPRGEEDVAEMIATMEREYGLLGLTDVVWNHTAHNSAWLQEHPEAGYSPATAPWLEAALELDSQLLEYSRRLGELRLPTEVRGEEDLLKIMGGMREGVVDEIKLWEYYAVDVKRDRAAIIEAWKKGNVTPAEGLQGRDLGDAKTWGLKQKADFLLSVACPNRNRILGRHSRAITPATGAALLNACHGAYAAAEDDDDSLLPVVTDHLTRILDEANLPLFNEFDKDVNEIFDQLFARTKYLRLEPHGPQLGPITEECPLIEPYFTRLPLNATTKKHDRAALALVNNGWVWNADAMVDHAGPESKAYLLRQVIVWGDCVKLRYGRKPEDNPYLWQHMAGYTRLMAKYFAGFRIDNCHSTALPVAEYLLDEARKVRPHIAVFAELFTGTEETDYVFAKRLGLNALIREAMQCWSPGELSRLVHRHGGIPIGSFDPDLPRDNMVAASSEGGKQEVRRHIQHAGLSALFMDCTHDNEMPAQKRTARDALPNAALVGLCGSATGSVMGYDEIYPSYVNLVSETRQYASPYSESDKPPEPVGEGGIGGVKRVINELHTRLAVEGYTETHIHHDAEFITVHRVHPTTRAGVLLIAHTAFPGSSGTQAFAPVHLTGTKAKLMGAWKLEVDDSPEARKAVAENKERLLGLPSKVTAVDGVEVREDGQDTFVHTPPTFPAGAIALLDTWIPDGQHTDDLARLVTSGADEAFKTADLVDLNFALYKCDAEERDASGGAAGVYDVPGFGPLVYAGLQGWWSVLDGIVRGNDLGHPLCDNLRAGTWALDYIVARMEHAVKSGGYERLAPATQWLRERFDKVRAVPSFLVPRYFAMVVQTAYFAARRRAVAQFRPEIQSANAFVRELAMVSVQQVGFVESASLWPGKRVPSLAAGLPHFSTGWARCWGRDVMISLRGLLVATGRYEVAKEHLRAFGSVVKHGMVPNLLNAGREPRYNSRDSVWFFLQVLQDYTKDAPEGEAVLQEKVPRRFLPYDDEWFPVDDERAYSRESTFEDIIQEILQRHASGISFREHNAGPDLDRQMRDEGFQIDVKVDWATGMVFGGNQWNCGTWQDKMGESEKAGNKGYPGTPRDGAAVEITGLLYSALRWVEDLHQSGLYRYAGVKGEKGADITFAAWADKIKANFERCYWIPRTVVEDAQYDVDSSIVNRRGIYKDLYRSGKPYEDYQLRANFPIAMTAAPDLFDPEKALYALSVADDILRGPTGMATLDPSDYNYRPYYNNGEDSTDFATAKGRNYHQGPEWLWPTGYFLRAFLRFGLMAREGAEERTEMFQQVTKRLGGCRRAIWGSPWMGLTELTNRGGEFCADSSPSQAWSAGCLLDLFHDGLVLQRGR